MNLRRILSQIALVTGTLLFSVGLQTFAAQTWTPPTAPPPNANAHAPINTGPRVDTKEGGLLIGTGNALTGLIVLNGNVGIGMLNPSKKLDVLGDISATGSICTAAGVCLSSVAGLGQSVYLQDGDCVNGGSLVGNSTCTDSGGGSTLNTMMGSLLASNAADNTVTIWHPSRTENVSCAVTVAGMRINFSATYSESANNYEVSAPWINTVIPLGGSARGCYQGGNCGEAQSNMSINDSMSTVRTRNSSGGITTTITHEVYMAGSFWLSNGRGSGSCTQRFNT